MLDDPAEPVRIESDADDDVIGEPPHVRDADSSLAPEHAEQRAFDGLHAAPAAPLDLTDAMRLLVEPHDDGRPGTVRPAADIDRVPAPTSEAHPDAIENPVDGNARVDGDRGTPLRGPVETPPPQLARQPTGSHELVAGGPRLLRDRFTLLEITRYRVVSFRQLQAQVFGNLHKAVLTRRVQALKVAGFLSTWEDRLVLGGRPCFALPTKDGLTWALDELKAETAGTPHAKLVQTMIGETAKRPLMLAPRTAPPFLPHQDETNRVVAALEAIPELGITWASTWHRPFPNAVRHVAMPQPDAVLVATHDGVPHLVFLEHDRGQEAPASFAQKKAKRYASLALFGFTQELFGFTHFTVWVTVNDVANGKPLQRIRALQAVSENARMMRFTLAGWIPAYAHERPVWFTPGMKITNNERRPDVHPNLVDAFARSDDSLLDAAAADLLRRLDEPLQGSTSADDPSSHF
ncbi:MAG TPA: replication-relaxation family protein [Thermoanaerobaculia bacterium]|nr:replication-relaxation family protein [Thermoanaerobaculia bacterium]